MMPRDELSTYQMPPRPRNAQGALRKVGLELELAHLTIEATLAIVQGAMGGEIKLTSRTEGSVEGTRFGTFKVELDSKPLKERRYLEPLEHLGIASNSATAQRIEDTVLEVAKELVPIEIVTPPIAWGELQELDALWIQLREAGAEDTQSSVLHAFGLHLNPEAPDFEVRTLLSFLQSFLLLQDWIIEEAHTDLTRRIAPYIRDFPEPYRRKVLSPDYAPDFLSFVHDYAEHNPTRNRPLDLLPLFTYVLRMQGQDLAAFSARIDDWQLVGVRPTFHYRLPNCEIAKAGWSPALDCNRWLEVERLAAQPELLSELSTAYLSTFDLPLRLQRGAWAEQIRERMMHTPQTIAEQATGS